MSPAPGSGAESPADRARRALREARRTDAAPSEPAAPAAPEPATPTAEPEADAHGRPSAPRPADAAREALRAARRESGTGDGVEDSGVRGGGVEVSGVRGEGVEGSGVRGGGVEGSEDSVPQGRGAGNSGFHGGSSANRSGRKRTRRPVGSQPARQAEELRRMLREAVRGLDDGAVPQAAAPQEAEPSNGGSADGESADGGSADAKPRTGAAARPRSRPRTRGPVEADGTSMSSPATLPGPEAEEAGDAGETGETRETRETRETPARRRAGAPGELRRTFPANWPGRDGTDRGRRVRTRTDRGPASRARGTDKTGETTPTPTPSWWGTAWINALEAAALDPARLARGRRYADGGHVDAITVTPGLVLAYVHGSRPRPYRVRLTLRTFSDAEWDGFLEAAADRPGHIAALLDRELPHSLAEDGVGLLPGPGELHPECSCPDAGRPCKHAAALCYRTARLLDEDPFLLLLLRGRGERTLLDALSRRNATRAARADRSGISPSPARLPGVRASDALAPRDLPPLPAPLPPPAHPGRPPVCPAPPGGPDPLALDQLATDAAARAHALLTGGTDPVGELSLWQDAVRLAAARPGSGLTAASRAHYAALAAAVGRSPAELARAVAAWRQGGIEGLAVLEEPWDPPAGPFDRARPALRAALSPAGPPFKVWRNRLTHPRGHLQLRLGRDNLWYAYESEPNHDDWWPRGTPTPDPVDALALVAAPEDPDRPGGPDSREWP
ncbi:SWIM zinc finger family protein [Streptomyces sp. NPDC002851]